MPFVLPIGNAFLGVDEGDKGEHDNDANNLENTSDDLAGLGLIELFLFLFSFSIRLFYPTYVWRCG